MNSKSLVISFVVATALLWNVAYKVGNQSVSENTKTTKQIFIASIVSQ